MAISKEIETKRDTLNGRKKLLGLKVSDLVWEYESSFVGTWEGLDKAAKDFKKQQIKTVLVAEWTEILLCR